MTDEIKQKLKSPSVTTPLLVIFVLAAMQLSKLALSELGSDTNVFVAVGVIQLIVLALPCILYYLIKGRKLSSPMYLGSIKGSHVFFVIFSAMLFVSGMLLIKFIYYVNGGGIASLVNFYEDFSGTTEGSNELEIILSLIVVPAVCEELFFRGIVLSEYRPYGTANAVIVSALCFSMLHFSLENFFVYLFAGLLLGFVTAVSRSIIPAIALHLLSNTLSIYASDLFLRIMVKKNGAYFIGFVLTVLFLISLALVFSRVESICYDYASAPPTEALPPKSAKNWAKVFLSPAFLILIAVFVCITVLL